jgi:hypothetical protein
MVDGRDVRWWVGEDGVTHTTQSSSERGERTNIGRLLRGVPWYTSGFGAPGIGSETARLAYEAEKREARSRACQSLVESPASSSRTSMAFRRLRQRLVWGMLRTRTGRQIVEAFGMQRWSFVVLECARQQGKSSRRSQTRKPGSPPSSSTTRLRQGKTSWDRSVIAGRGVSDGGATGYDLGGVGEGVTVESLQRQVVAERERADALDKRRQEQVDNQVKIIDRLKAENLAMEAEIRRLKSLGGNGTW